MAQLLAELGIDKSHGRPRVSNDNPFSEALFKTAKYRPAMPERFASLAHAREVFRGVFNWYNNEHHHSGILYLTPSVVHHGRADEILDRRHRTRMAAYLAHSERFVNGQPQRERLPSEVWINPPENTTHQDAPGSTQTDPDDPEVVRVCRTYGSFETLAFMPRELAAAPKAAH